MNEIIKKVKNIKNNNFYRIKKLDTSGHIELNLYKDKYKKVIITKDFITEEYILDWYENNEWSKIVIFQDLENLKKELIKYLESLNKEEIGFLS
jgi:hypothetical protein